MIMKLVTVAIGGPDNPVLAQGEFVKSENGLTFVKISDNVVVRGRLITSDKGKGSNNG